MKYNFPPGAIRIIEITPLNFLRSFIVNYIFTEYKLVHLHHKNSPFLDIDFMVLWSFTVFERGAGPGGTKDYWVNPSKVFGYQLYLVSYNSETVTSIAVK